MFDNCSVYVLIVRLPVTGLSNVTWQNVITLVQARQNQENFRRSRSSVTDENVERIIELLENNLHVIYSKMGWVYLRYDLIEKLEKKYGGINIKSTFDNNKLETIFKE